LIYLYCSDYRKKLQVWRKKHDPEKEEFVYPWPKEPEWTKPEIYALEQFYLGESFSCKTIDAYGTFFKDEHKSVRDIRKVKDKSRMSPIKGIVRSFFEFKVKKETSKYYGQPMIKAVIEDVHGEQCTCTIFPDRWGNVKSRIKEVNSKAEFAPGLALSFSGSTNNYEDDIGIILDDLYNLSMSPAIPADLKPKKINLKEAKAKIETEETLNNKDSKGLFEEMEDYLYDMGLIDLDEEEQEDSN
jgi:DNA polymerase III alpha subunit